MYFHDLSDWVPLMIVLTIPSGYNTRFLKEKDKYKFYGEGCLGDTIWSSGVCIR